MPAGQLPTVSAATPPTCSRRAFLGSVALSALAVAGGSCAQAGPTPRSVPRIGLLSISSETSFRPALEEFRQGLADLGYRERETIDIEYRWAGTGDQTIVGRLADELVALPDLRLFVAHGGSPTLVLRTRTRAPIVMTNTPDPVENGHIASLAEPGGNITGVAIPLNATTAKGVELLKELVPALTTFGFLSGPSAFGAGRSGAISAAKALGLRVEMMDVRMPDELDPAFQKAVGAGVQAVVTGSDAFNQDHQKRIQALLLRYRLPGVHYFSSYVRDGGLASLAQGSGGLFKQCAKHIDRILKGASPATMPVEVWALQALVVNLTAARGLGIDVPESVLARATEVVR